MKSSTYKTCTRCGVEKSHAEFYKDKSRKDGLQYRCKACDNERNKKRYQENRKQVRESQKKWAKNNPHICRARNQKRRAIKIRAAVALTDNERLALQILTEECTLLGPGWHLDHLVPLSKGGLHHPDNLQIVRASYNLQKNTKIFNRRKYY